MNTENLEVGMVLKSYPDLCKKLGIVPKRGNSKLSQLKEMSRKFIHQKVEYGNSIIIKEIFDKEKPKKISKGNKQYSIKKFKTHHLQFIYSTLGNNLDDIYVNSTQNLMWRCESCNKLFIDRVDRVVNNERVKCKDCTISKGSRYIKSLLNDAYINYKTEIKFEGLESKIASRAFRFDYGIYDFKDNLLGIIEYDGGYHDTHEGTQENDKIKNKYCEDNNIPLLRIHHTDKHVIIKVVSFLEKIGCEILFDKIIKLKDVEINKIKTKIDEIDIQIESMVIKRNELEEYLNGY